MQIPGADAESKIAGSKCRWLFGCWTWKSLKVDADADVKVEGLVAKEER